MSVAMETKAYINLVSHGNAVKATNHKMTGEYYIVVAGLHKPDTSDKNVIDGFETKKRAAYVGRMLERIPMDNTAVNRGKAIQSSVYKFR